MESHATRGRSQAPAFHDTSTSVHVGRSCASCAHDTSTSVHVVYQFHHLGLI